MRRTASEVVRELEIRVARLEKEAGVWNVVKTNLLPAFADIEDMWDALEVALNRMDHSVSNINIDKRNYGITFDYDSYLKCSGQLVFEADRTAGIVSSAIRVSVKVTSIIGRRSETDFGGLGHPIAVFEYEPNIRSPREGKFELVERKVADFQGLLRFEKDKEADMQRQQQAARAEAKRLRGEMYNR